MSALDRAWIRREVEGIRGSTASDHKGRRLEALIRTVFLSVAGLALEDQDVKSAYATEEMDLYFWNDREREGLHFLDCPLVVECKGWSTPASGAQLRTFATTLKDKGRANGVFVALEGVAGEATERTAGFFHVASAMASGQTVLVLTADDLVDLTCGADVVRILRRRLTDQVRDQVLAIEARRQSSARPRRKKKSSVSNPS